MPRDNFWDGDSALKAEASELRRRHRQAEHGVTVEDFCAHMPSHTYMFRPARCLWPAASVNARIPPLPLTDQAGNPVMKDGKPVMLSASAWLDRYCPVEQITWAPGLPEVIENRLLLEGGWNERFGVASFNLYKAPTIETGDAAKAGPWLDHMKHIYPEEADHIINWLAHRVQRPHEKINHALVLGGAQGIGKDTILEPVKYAVGPWNFQEASPAQILGRFNSFVKSVVLRISEARDLGEYDRFKFYDHMKAYTAAPPDMLRVDEKNLREYLVVNCCGVVITTNHRTDGIFLSPDDRRHFVAWSSGTKEDDHFAGDYWKKLWGYYGEGGHRHVAAFLQRRDLAAFDPKAPPPKTAAFWTIVDTNRPPEEAEMTDLLEAIGQPVAVPLSRICEAATGDFSDWIKDRKNRRAIPHRLEKCGYAPVRNPDAKDGLWKILGKRQAVYAKADLSVRDQLLAVRRLL